MAGESIWVVTFPFIWINKGNDDDYKDIKLSDNYIKNIIAEMRNNPNITKEELVKLIGISSTAIDNDILYLKNYSVIIRGGSSINDYVSNYLCNNFMN